MFGLGFMSNVLVESFAIDILPKTVPLAVLWMVFWWLVVPFAVYVLTLQRLVRKRLARFFNAPFCYHCEYTIPELVCTPDEAAVSSSTLRCTECGTVIPRIVVTRRQRR